MNSDLTVYTYHPRQRLLWAPIVFIIAMAIFGFVRGLMGAGDLNLEPSFGNRGAAPKVGVDPRPVVLQTIPTLTPRLIGPAPPAPKAPVAVNAPTTAQVTNAAVNAPFVAPVVTVKAEPAPTEAAPTTPVQQPTTAPPPPQPALQGLY
jgi:hypothetical protein